LKLLKKKSGSLLVPLILWNIPLAAAVFFIQKYGLINFDFSSKLYPFSIKSWGNALTGLKGTPINYPLNFLRDLFMISLLSPLYWQLLKRLPYTGFLAVFTVYFFNLDGPWVLRNSMLISFYIGALAAHKQWDLKRLDVYAPYLLTVLVSACIILVIYRIPNREPLRLIAPFLVWPSIHLILNTRFAELLHRHAKNSFVTYLSHGPVILMIWLVFNRLPLQLPYFLYWTLTPIIAVFVAVLIRMLLKRLSPKLASIALGGRV
jgi:succinoglycan biosynthesis protein ExoH